MRGVIETAASVSFSFWTPEGRAVSWFARLPKLIEKPLGLPACRPKGVGGATERVLAATLEDGVVTTDEAGRPPSQDGRSKPTRSRQRSAVRQPLSAARSEAEAWRGREAGNR